MKNIAVSLSLLIVLNGMADGENMDSGTKPRDCSAYSNLGTIAQCAGVQYTQGIIDDKTFSSVLHHILDKLPVMSRAYSIGFTTGAQIDVYLGSIKDPRFEDKYGYSYQPSDWLRNYALISIKALDSKPILLYIVGEMPDVPLWKPDSAIMQRMGDQNLRTIYRDVNAAAVDTNDLITEDCGGLQKWAAESYIEDWRNVVIVMPPNLWCNQNKGGLAALMIKEVFEISSSMGGSKVKTFATQEPTEEILVDF